MLFEVGLIIHGINVLYIPNDMPVSVKNALCFNLSVDIDCLTAY